MRFLNYIDKHLEEIVLVIMLSCISIIMILQVIMRFIFKNALSWAEELSVQLYIVSVFFSIGYCIRHRKMLRIEIVESLMPQSVRKGLAVVGEVVNAFVWGYLFSVTFSTIRALYKTHAMLPATRIPQYLMYIIYMLALGLALVRAVEMAVRYMISHDDTTEETGGGPV